MMNGCQKRQIIHMRAFSETAGPFTDKEIKKETENFFDISILDKNNRKKLIELIRFKLGAQLPF